MKTFNEYINEGQRFLRSIGKNDVVTNLLDIKEFVDAFKSVSSKQHFVLVKLNGKFYDYFIVHKDGSKTVTIELNGDMIYDDIETADENLGQYTNINALRRFENASELECRLTDGTPIYPVSIHKSGSHGYEKIIIEFES